MTIIASLILNASIETGQSLSMSRGVSNQDISSITRAGNDDSDSIKLIRRPGLLNDGEVLSDGKILKLSLFPNNLQYVDECHSRYNGSQIPQFLRDEYKKVHPI